MNTIDGALFTFLNSSSTITAFVGVGTAARIYPLKLEQSGILPALSFFTIIDESEQDESGHQVGWAYARLQISAWSKSITQAKQVGEALRLLLNSYRGLWDDVRVRVVGFSRGPDLYEDDVKIYHVPCQITLWYEQTTAF